ncbi:hypothetical protein, partial [Streptococcus pneumoniae]|uniref:hypothetical protein n=1 Tax=Streptococcus pneumoniae TaxID=1313 RepID=UPI00398F2858
MNLVCRLLLEKRGGGGGGGGGGRSTRVRSSAASDVYKRQHLLRASCWQRCYVHHQSIPTVSYTHLRAHETLMNLV